MSEAQNRLLKDSRRVRLMLMPIHGGTLAFDVNEQLPRKMNYES